MGYYERTKKHEVINLARVNVYNKENDTTWEEWQMGGGCLALGCNVGKGYALITTSDGMDYGKEYNKPHFSLGIYDTDGELLDGKFYPNMTLNQALSLKA